jgi:hypothetical protein
LQANTQGLGNVINTNYTPSNQEETEVFHCQQEYMYSVFLLTMQRDFGKRLVRQHENTQDAQTIFSKYVKYYSDSIKAELESTKVYEYLANTRLGDGTWKGTYHAFILHYTDQFLKYDNMQTTAELIPPKTKRRLLENAVSQIPQLATIKDTANITHANSGKLLDYDSYLALLENAATVLDNKYATGTKSRTSRLARSTQQHEFDETQITFTPPSHPNVRLVHMMDHLICDEHLPDDGEIYDIDSPVKVITAQAHKRTTFADNRSPPNGHYGTNRPFRLTTPPDPEARLAQEIYAAMSRASKEHWRQIDIFDKLRILGKSVPANNDNNTRDVNLHNISLADYIELTQLYQQHNNNAHAIQSNTHKS